MSFASAYQSGNSHTLATTVTSDAGSRAGFAVHLFLIAVVASLCGAWVELLTRKYGLPVNPTRVALLAGFAAIALQCGARGGPAQLWLAALLVFLSVWGSIGPLLAMYPDWSEYQSMVLALAVGTAIAFCSVWLPYHRDTLRHFAFYAAIGMCVMAVTFLPYVVSGSHPPGPRTSSWHIHGGIARMPWTLDDPNMFASSLLVLLAACFYCWEQTPSFRMRLFYLAGIASGCVMLLLSMSRAGVIGLAIGFAFYSLFQGRRKLAAYLVLAVVATCIAISTPVGEHVLARVMGQLDGGSSTSVRLQQYAYAFQLGIDAPFGVGLGQSLGFAKASVGYRIHSSVLEPFAELGLIGFLLVSGAMLVVFYRWLKIGALARGTPSFATRTDLEREWIMITSVIVAMGFVAMTIPITNRTSLWFTIGLVAWYATGFRRRLYLQQWHDWQQANDQSPLVIQPKNQSSHQSSHQSRRIAA